MRTTLIREVVAVVAGLAGTVLAVWLLVTFVVAGEWGRLGLGLGVVVCAGLAVWAGRYDPVAVAAREERRGQAPGQGAAVDSERVRMPTLPPRR